MKNIVKQIAVYTFFLYCSSLSAALLFKSKTQEPGFEIQNKSSKPIWVAVINNESTVINNQQINSGKRVSAKIDPEKPTNLFVWRTNPTPFQSSSDSPSTKPRFSLIQYVKREDPKDKRQSMAYPQFTAENTEVADSMYSFKPGKTIYLTWDKDNFPRPQTGKAKGMLKKTESGFSLSNNVMLTDIIDDTSGKN